MQVILFRNEGDIFFFSPPVFVYQRDNLYVYWPAAFLPLASWQTLIKAVIVQTCSPLIILSNLSFQPAHCPPFN